MKKNVLFVVNKEEQVKKLIVSPTKKAFICDECLELCIDILEGKYDEKEK